jgi:replicative DNA helicase
VSTPPQELRGSAAFGLAAPSGRVLPHDLDAEQAVLGCLLIDANAILAVRDFLDPGDFYAERHGHIFRAALALSDRGEPVDILTLKVQLERDGSLARSGGIEYLAELSQKMPTAASVPHYAQIVVDHSMRRRLIGAAGEMAQLGFDAGQRTEDILDTAERRIFAIADSRRSLEISHIAQMLTETWELMESRAQSRQIVHGVPTNYSRLDAVTQGLQPGELIILAARPSVGKTSFALNIARNAAVLADRRVVIFSLEMSKQALVQRLICSEAKVDAYLISTGQADAHAFERIAGAMDRLSQANIWIDDTPALPISELRARARRMRAQQKVDLVVVDYLQLMRGGRQDSRVQEVSEISSGLKTIAKELHVPVLALSQLSRESERRENRKPQLSDLRDSGSIEQDADVVLFLYRPGMHKDDIDRSVTELLVEKNRNGPTTKIDLHFQANQMVFYEPARE